MLLSRLAPEEADTHFIRTAKSTVILLLLGAFASEIACVYANTVAGDQLMANGDAPLATALGTLDDGWVGRSELGRVHIAVHTRRLLYGTKRVGCLLQ